jgi:alkylation response protein AidB-like acyl-CoA dehydrogenase
MQDLASFAMDLEDMGGVMVGDDSPQVGAFQQSFMWAPGLRIAGGTDEILKNIIAERVLGLPADIRVDKDIPYNKLPTGR